jgi:hypothetical protein
MALASFVGGMSIFFLLIIGFGIKSLIAKKINFGRKVIVRKKNPVEYWLIISLIFVIAFVFLLFIILYLRKPFW